jgi:glycosyltransferase involved in cell wall biosynthesis
MTTVSICIPTYNAERTLEQTVKSIQSQTFRNWTLRIVDNASTDNTIRLARAYSILDGRIQVEAFRENIGAEGNFTRCLGMMNGTFGAIFHADDIYRPQMLEHAIQVLENDASIGAVFCEAEDIGDDGNTIGPRQLPHKLRRPGSLVVMEFDDLLENITLYGNWLICPSAVVRSSIYRDEIILWNGNDFRTSADLDVWLRIAKRHRIAIQCMPLIGYRVTQQSTSFNIARTRTGEHDIFKVLDAWVPPINSYGHHKKLQKNIAMLREKDNINRCINYLLRGEFLAACRLWSKAMCSQNLCFALWNPWHRKYRFIGFAMLPFLFLSWASPVRHLLGKLRFSRGRE